MADDSIDWWEVARYVFVAALAVLVLGVAGLALTVLFLGKCLSAAAGGISGGR